jgi:threonine dehydrogenase-like Zn-dependent dehydrogenase
VTVTQSLSAVTLGGGAVELRMFPLPELTDEDALMAVEAAGVCGSDVPFHVGLRAGQPRIQGHENIGRILEIGKNAAARWNVGVGSRVALEEFIPCWTCAMCRTGNYRLCDNSDQFLKPDVLRYGDTPVDRTPSLWGGFGEVQYLHPNSLVYPLAEHVPAEMGPLFLPISNGLRWVREVANMPLGGTIVIFGPGQHGLGCVIGAREAGAGLIIVVGLESDRKRLDVARSLGAHATIASSDEAEVEKQVRELTGGEMADVLIDVTPGTVAPLILAMRLAKKLGIVILAGGKHQRINDLDAMEIYKRELTIRAVRGHDVRSVTPAIKLLESGRYDLTSLMTHRYTLDEVGRALDTMAGRGDVDSIHLTVMPTRSRAV